jgi:hypothetical protein
VKPTDASKPLAVHCVGHIDRGVELPPYNRPFLRSFEWLGYPYFANTDSDISQQNLIRPRNKFLV